MAEGRAAGVVFLFLDGVGLGGDDPDANPVAAARLPRLRSWVGGAPVRGAPARSADGVVFRALDANLDHDGLPQSATGQTTLLTGVNAAALMGRHYGPWPGPTLRRALAEGTLFHHGGPSAALANAYPEGYFRAERAGRLRPSAPVVAARAAGVSLRDLDSFRRGEAIAADLTGDGLADLDGGVEPVPAARAGARLAALARRHAFTFLDVWLTDRLGHRRDRGAAVDLLEVLDAFLDGLADALDGATLVLTSDHGNLEDLSHGRHTRNPVPLVAVGPAASAFDGVRDLTGVAPAVRAALAAA